MIHLFVANHSFTRLLSAFILKKKPNSKISMIATAKKNTLAVRFPKHSITRNLLRQLRFPLAAPSANLSKKVSSVILKIN